MGQKYRLKSIDKTRNFFLEEIEQNQSMCRKHKRVCIGLFLILTFTITGCTSISVSLLWLVFL